MESKGKILRVTVIGLIVNLLLSIAKFTIGKLGRSSALMADAVHSLSDIVSDVAIIVGAKYWSKPADFDHPHGHRRIEIIVSFVIGILLFLTASKILIGGVERLYLREMSTPDWITFYIALLSIALKELLYHWTRKVGTDSKCMPLIANAWHHRSDAISSIPVAIAIALSAIYPGMWFLDSIGAIVVSFFIYQASYTIVHPSYLKLIDTGVSRKIVGDIKRIVSRHPELEKISRVRTRYLSSSAIIVNLDVEVSGDLTINETDRIREAIREDLLKSGLSIMDVTVQFNT